MSPVTHKDMNVDPREPLICNTLSLLLTTTQENNANSVGKKSCRSTMDVLVHEATLSIDVTSAYKGGHHCRRCNNTVRLSSLYRLLDALRPCGQTLGLIVNVEDDDDMNRFSGFCGSS